MQQQTRQRTTRERKSTPLPEKRGRKKQTTRSRHANTAHRHMVSTHRHSTITGKARHEERRGAEKREHNKGNTMVFGDNVRARKAARALPRTPTQTGREKKEEEKENREKRKTSNKTTTLTPRTAIPQPTAQQDNAHTILKHTHHTETHTTAHEELAVDSKYHTPFRPTQTITAIPQRHNPITKTQH